MLYFNPQWKTILYFFADLPSAENRMRQQNMFLFDFKWGMRRDGIDAKSVLFRLMTFRVAADASWDAVSKTFVFDAATACANEHFSATNRLLANERDDSDILFRHPRVLGNGCLRR